MTFEIIVGLNIVDEDTYTKYREGMLPILASYGGSFGYDFVVSKVLKSKVDAKINRVFSIDFPSEEIMNRFFSDPDYLDVKDKFFKTSVGTVTVISLHEKNT